MNELNRFNKLTVKAKLFLSSNSIQVFFKRKASKLTLTDNEGDLNRVGTVIGLIVIGIVILIAAWIV